MSTNATSVSAFGIFFLALFVIWGLNTIEWSFNMIWKVERSRPLMNKFISYWSAVTFAPILVAVSLVASAKLHGIMASEAWQDYSYLQSWTLKALPYLLVWIAFFLLYRLIPNTHVKFRPALIGAAVATLLFEGAKGTFNYYLANYATYKAIYGAIAILPIFLFWLYVTWLIVILGAVIAYAIQYPQEVKRESGDGFDRRRYQTYYALRILMESVRSFETAGGAADPEATQEKLGITGEFYGEIVRELAKAGYIERLEGNGRFLLTRPPEKVDVAEVVATLNPSAFTTPPAPDDAGRRLLKELFARQRGGIARAADDMTLLALSLSEDTLADSPPSEPT